MQQRERNTSLPGVSTHFSRYRMFLLAQKFLKVILTLVGDSVSVKSNRWNRVSRLRPAGQIRPVKPFHQGAKAFYQ